MSTFYLLPSRPLLGERCASLLRAFFPGLDFERTRWAELADMLGGVILDMPDVFVIYREELPADEDPTTALTEGYGAVAGDEVIEVRVADKSGALHTRRWRLGGAES